MEYHENIDSSGALFEIRVYNPYTILFIAFTDAFENIGYNMGKNNLPCCHKCGKEYDNSISYRQPLCKNCL